MNINLKKVIILNVYMDQNFEWNNLEFHSALFQIQQAFESGNVEMAEIRFHNRAITKTPTGYSFFDTPHRRVDFIINKNNTGFFLTQQDFGSHSFTRQMVNDMIEIHSFIQYVITKKEG